jgi:uncharacterized protein YecE (DUF72 family)
MDLQLGLFPDSEPRAGRSGVGPVPVRAELARVAASLPSGLRLGTSSWSFPGWEGIVYDRSATAASLARSGLAAYARHPLFRTVGLDRTYYRPISAEVFREYAEEVPDDFRFLVKASRRITSLSDPDAPGRRTPNPDFLDPGYAIREVVGPAVQGLGRLLGPILFQFSPGPASEFGGQRGFAARLDRFLEALPTGPLYAVEVRTPGLLGQAYAEVLERHGASHGYVIHPTMPPVERQTTLIAPHYQPALVVRWMLGGGQAYEAARDRYDPFDRLVDEDPVSRHAVAVAVLDALIAEREAFVIANNKAEGSAPLTLERLAEHVLAWRSGTSPSGAWNGADPHVPGVE